MRRTYYKICEYCGCTLDPQEVCDCDQREGDQNGDQTEKSVFRRIQSVYAVSGVAGKEKTETLD